MFTLDDSEDVRAVLRIVRPEYNLDEYLLEGSVFFDPEHSILGSLDKLEQTQQFRTDIYFQTIYTLHYPRNDCANLSNTNHYLHHKKIGE